LQNVKLSSVDLVAQPSTVQNGTIIVGGPTEPPQPTTPPGDQTPFPNGVPHAIPGKIEAEDFDIGGEGTAYHDYDALNRGNSSYRLGEGVDITYVDADDDDGDDIGDDDVERRHVGWVENNEWLEYTINVTETGSYTFQARVSHGGLNSGGTFHMEIDGQDVTGTMTVPNTGTWDTFQIIEKQNVTLNAGQHVMRVYMDGLGGGGTDVADIDYFNFILTGAKVWGDVDGDGHVNSVDLQMLSYNYGSTNYPLADFDENGVINSIDLGILSYNYGT
jgi:hypothetical protein